MSENTKFHSGFITIVGRPNVGKSTLMNAMVGEKIAIVSSRPQTTRNRIMGVMTRPDWQIVFLDTPGIHTPRTKLGESMMQSVKDAMDGMDGVLVLVDATQVGEHDRAIVRDMAGKKVPKVLAINKIDLLPPEKLLGLIASFADLGYDAIIPISAKTGDGLDDLTKQLATHLPEGPKYFPDDMMTDQPERLIWRGADSREGAPAFARRSAARHRRGNDGHGEDERQLHGNQRDDLLRTRRAQGHHYRQARRNAANHRLGGARGYREAAGAACEFEAVGEGASRLAQPCVGFAHAGV